jgi:general secretion pathway protein M
MNIFSTWWNERSLRERVLLTIMLLLLATTIFIFGIWQPIQRWQTSSIERLERSSKLSDTVRRQADWIRSNAAPRDQGQSTADTVVESATNSGFQITRTDLGSDGSVKVEIASARSMALFAWLSSLDEQGIFVDAIQLTTKSDATLRAIVTVKQAKS